MRDKAETAADELITRIRAIVGRPNHPSLAGFTGYDEMVPAVYWPKTWLVGAFIEIALAVQEQCYLIARGGEHRFEKHGASQIYWKGRSDAANEIRALKLRTTRQKLT